MDEFLKEDERNKEETVGIYVDMQSRQEQVEEVRLEMAEAEVRYHEQVSTLVDMEGATSTWHMANNNRKRIKELGKAVAALTVLVIISFFITFILATAMIWKVI